MFICYIVALISEMVDCRYLAKTTGPSTYIAITYIAFVTKMQKRQTQRNKFALIKKRYPKYFSPLIFLSSDIQVLKLQ